MLQLREDYSYLDGKSTCADVLSSQLLSYIASRLLKDWIPVCLELGMEIRQIEMIETRFPNDVYRQALEALNSWQSGRCNKENSSHTVLTELHAALKECNRNDIVDQIPKVGKRLLKRSLMCNQQIGSLHKRPALMLGRTSVHYGDTHVTCPVYTGKSTVMQIENCSNPNAESDIDESHILTVKVIHKSIVCYGRKIKKSRLALLLYTDELKYIKANVFGEHIEYINEHMNDDLDYKLSGFSIKRSEYYNEDEIRLYKWTKIIRLSQNTIPPVITRKLRIGEIKREEYAKKRVSLFPVIVTSVGPRRRPKKKFLTEVMVKDYTGKIKMNIWSRSDEAMTNGVERGKVIELVNVEVGIFNDEVEAEYTITLVDISQIKDCGNIMQELLEMEDINELTPVTMSISEVPYLIDQKRKQHVIISKVQIETFVKDRNFDFIYKNCDSYKNHGKLQQKNGHWFCKGCDTFKDGIDMVQLRAEIVDGSSDQSIWVKLFNASSEVVLGQLYKTFLKSSRQKQNHMLDQVASKDEMYTIEIIYNHDFDTQIVKKLDVEK